MEYKIEIKCDWLSFTYHAPDHILDQVDLPFEIDYFLVEFPEFCQILGDRPYLNGDSKRYYGYDHCFLFNGIKISYCDKQKSSMGVNISIPGSYVESVFNLFGLDYFDLNDRVAFYKMIFARNCRFTRFDLAIDDFTKVFTPRVFANAMMNNKIVSNFRSWRYVSSQQNQGDTFYLGDRKKQVLRIYDKSYESKGVIDSVRYEFEMHGDRANSFLSYFIEHDGKIAFGDYLCSWLRLLNKEKDSNSHRESYTDQAFLSFVTYLDNIYSVKDRFNAKLHQYTPNHKKLLSKRDFVLQKTARPVATIIDTFYQGDRYKFIDHLYEIGTSDLNNLDIELRLEYQAQVNTYTLHPDQFTCFDLFEV